VIIPAHNEEENIVKTIASIRRASPEKSDEKNDITDTANKADEIIVVCNKCSDKTAQVARKRGCVVIETKTQGVSFARNLGAKKASGEIVCFLDADTSIAKNLLDEVRSSVCNGAVGGFTRTFGDSPHLRSRIMWRIGNFGRIFFPAASGFMFSTKLMYPEFDESKNIAEDTYFLLNLRKKGKLKYIRNSYVITSMRRQEKLGYARFVWQTFSGFFVPRKQKYQSVR
jgi:glycosyltransferase involved in cell wall biosynthesis